MNNLLNKKYSSDMMKWINDLWPLPRSLTGKGTIDTLNYLKDINPELNIQSFKSGESVFDWRVPDEWNIKDAYIEHESGKRFAEFSENNLHLVGYSIPCNLTLNLDELLGHIHSLPEQPDVIPYVTSYYKDEWGFCLSHKTKEKLPKGSYKILIDSTKSKGKMHLADVLLEGSISEEIFMTTYICHPSMANNELSGPALATALIKYIKDQYPSNRFSYRFVFAPETIGAIAYLSRNINHLKNNVIAGFNLSCVGDDRAYSHIESPSGKTLADIALHAALIGKNNVKTYSFLERGSDERQYCSPNVALPFCGFSRSKYGTYPEYHTSADNLDLVTEAGLFGSFEVFTSIIDAFESGLYPRSSVICEPQLGKRGLYPSISRKDAYNDILKMRMNLLAYADGSSSIFEIANKIDTNLSALIAETEILKKENLIEISNQREK